MITKPACKTGIIKMPPMKGIKAATKTIKLNIITNTTALPQLPFNCCKALFLSLEMFSII
ncbi:MAG: hypothetical protein LBD88_05440 [Candidatus Peribacteria bacterium]|nr:hypothetical protein [Candidatus Peribacteria bacterium]